MNLEVYDIEASRGIFLMGIGVSCDWIPNIYRVSWTVTYPSIFVEFHQNCTRGFNTGEFYDWRLRIITNRALDAINSMYMA